MNRYTSLFRTNSITGPGVIVLLITLLIILGFGNNAHGGAISQTPLYLTLEGVDPNIMVIVDDSGSMGWEYLPDSVGSISTSAARRYSSTVNKIYYNPAIVYKPPLNSDGTSFPNENFYGARSNGYNSSSSTVNLNGKVYYVYRGDTIPLPSNCDGTVNDNDCYQSVTVSATSGPGGTDERTNFANWYSYYRQRIYTAKAGISRAFGPQGYDLRVGYGRINDSSSTTIDGKSVTTIVRGVRPFLDVSTTDKKRSEFFTWLYNLTASGVTPLRRALDAAGLYYENDSNTGPWSATPGITPPNPAPALLSCRQSYTILMTDGYWNSNEAATSGARANNDGTAGPTITGPSPTCTAPEDCQTFSYEAKSPFIDDADTNPKTNTLADIAMHYWKRDLLPNTDNRVPTNSVDPAFWQHMVVFGIGLGVPTVKVDPDAAFNAINTGASISWPDPQTNITDSGTTVPARIDDLLHASVNSRGGFFSAQDPDEFATQLQQILESIIGREASSSSAAPTTTTGLETDTLVFRAEFDPRDWSGRVRAYEFNNIGVLKPNPKWDTHNTIPVYDNRKIYTRDGSNTVEFRWTSLNAGQKTALKTLGSVVSDDTVGENRLKWIRGERANENDQPNGTLRTRNRLLGDIVNSDPLYVEGASSKTLYVGANDGMLHAFDALTGSERFAYIPTAVFPNLSSLTDPEYAHKYFVDGSPVYQKPDSGSDNGKLILVGTTGAGGRSVFALDVTDPGSFSVRWELTNATDSELGCAIGKPQIGQLKNGTWVAVFGNGYNSGSTKRCDEIPPSPDPSKAFLFVVDLTSGLVIAKIPAHADTANGLSTPTLLRDSNDGRIIAAYAGDLKGHLVKFDLITNTVAFNAPLFTARNASTVPSTTVQPITAAPEIARHPNGGYLIFFGTGKYYEVGDHTAKDIPTQSLYGIWDTATFNGAWQGGSAITSTNRSVLRQQTIIGEKMEAGNKWRLTSENPIDWTSDRGWYLDLTTAGERVTYQARILSTQVVIFETRIPYNSEDPCIPSVGTSWLMTVNMLTGGRPAKAVIDVNRDSMFDQYDTIELNGELVVVSGFEMVAAGIGRATLLQFTPGIIDVIQSGSGTLTTTARGYENAEAFKTAAEALKAAAEAAQAAQAAADTAKTAADAAKTADDAYNKAKNDLDADPDNAALQAAAEAAQAAAAQAASDAATAAAAAAEANQKAVQYIIAAANAISALAQTIIDAGGGVVNVTEAKGILATAQGIAAKAPTSADPASLIRDLLIAAAPLMGLGDVGVRLQGEILGGVVPQRTWRQLQ